MKLTKTEIKEKREIVKRLETTFARIEQEAAAFNAADKDAEGAGRKLHEAIAEYNDAQDEATAFTNLIADQITDYIDDKSEKWAEGEAGEAHIAWRDQWQDAEFEELEWDDIVVPDSSTGELIASTDGIDSGAETLSDLPEEA